MLCCCRPVPYYPMFHIICVVATCPIFVPYCLHVWNAIHYIMVGIGLGTLECPSNITGHCFCCNKKITFFLNENASKGCWSYITIPWKTTLAFWCDIWSYVHLQHENDLLRKFIIWCCKTFDYLIYIAQKIKVEQI